MAEMPDIVIDAVVRVRAQVAVLEDHDELVKLCLQHLHRLHTTLWMDWILEEDHEQPDGTMQARGYTKAANWLANTIQSVLDLTAIDSCAQTDPPLNQPKGAL